MAKRKKTVAQLLASLADAIDLPAFSDSPATYVSRSQAIQYLSDSAHAFTQKHQAFGLLAASDTISIQAGSREYDLPDDFAALINLMFTDGAGEPQKIDRSDIDTIDLISGTSCDWVTTKPRYCILGEQLVFTMPRAQYSVAIRYVPEMPLFDSGDQAISDFSTTKTTDYILCKGAIDQWVVFDSAIKCLRKQQIDASAMQQARDEVAADMMRNLVDRSVVDSEQVRDAWGQSSYGSGDFGGRY